MTHTSVPQIHRNQPRMRVLCPARHPDHTDGHLCHRPYAHPEPHRCECGTPWETP